MGNAECCGPRDTSGVKINDPSKLARDGPSLEKVYKEGSLWVLSSPAPEKPKVTAEDTPKGEDAAEAPAASSSSTAPQSQWDKRYVVFTLQKVLVFPNEEAYKQKQEPSNIVTVVDDANFAIKSLELTAEETEQIDALKKEQEELAKSAADGDKKKKKKKKKDSDDEESDDEDGKKKKKKNSDDEESDESDSEAEDDEEEKDKKAARAKEIESLLQNLEFKRLSISITSSNGSVQVRAESTEEKEAWLLAGTQVQTDAGSLRQQIKDKQAKQEEEQKQQENSSKAAEEKGADKRSKEVGDVPSVQPIELEERYKALPTEVQDIIITLKEIDRDLVAYSDRDLATGKGKALNNKLKSLKPKLAEQKRNFPAELKDVVIQYNKLVHELPIKVNTTINNYNRAHAAKSSMF